MTPIGSPRVPSTVGSSLVTPVARNDAEPGDSALAARLTSPAMPASLAAATPSHGTPAEVDQSALPPPVPPLPCAAAMTGLTDRALPALPCFHASAASAASASRFASSTMSCPLSLRRDPEGARALFASRQDDGGHPIVARHPSTRRMLPFAGSRPLRTGFCPPAAPRAPQPMVAARRATTTPIRDALGPDAAQRIAIDIQAVVQGVLGTCADLNTCRKPRQSIEDLRRHVITELDKNFDENRRDFELAQERGIDEHDTLHERFEQLKSNLNDRLVGFLSSLSMTTVPIRYA